MVAEVPFTSCLLIWESSGLLARTKNLSGNQLENVTQVKNKSLKKKKYQQSNKVQNISFEPKSGQSAKPNHDCRLLDKLKNKQGQIQRAKSCMKDHEKARKALGGTKQMKVVRVNDL